MSTNNPQSTASDTPKPWLKYYTDTTPPHLDYGDLTLASIFHTAVNKYSDRKALWFMGASTTYSQFGELVEKAAGVLANKGVKPGDKVAVVLPNCPQNLVAFYAIVSLGATAVYHNPLYTLSELEGPFNDHAAKVAIFWDKAAGIAEHLVAHTPLETVLTVNMTKAMPLLKRLALSLPVPKVRAMKAKLTAGETRFMDWDAVVSPAAPGVGRRFIQDANPATTPRTPALILYTSGTTGKPKGAVLTHRNLVSNLIMGKAWVPGLGEQKEPDRMLAALPMFHAYGMTMNGTLAPLIGGEILLLPAPEPALLLEAIKKKRPTWIPGVPALYQAILRLADEENLDLSGVRASFSGASALPVKTVEKWENATGGRLVEGYGLTETSPIVLGNPMSDDRRPGHVGIPFPDTEARVVDQNDPTKVLDYGEEGELVVRGPQVFGGYLHLERLNSEVFADGWFRTGDMAVMEEDGFVKIVSRIKEMIVTGGFNVHPGEVEEVILKHPKVAEVAVIGLPKEDGSERVVAAVVVEGDVAVVGADAAADNGADAAADNGAGTDGDDGAGIGATPSAEKDATDSSDGTASAIDMNEITGDLADSLRRHSKKDLTGYKVPRRFYQVSELPADQMGKVRRTKMRQLLEQHTKR